MKFVLNEYHKNTPSEEFIKDVVDTANKLGKNTLTAEEYSREGKYHSSTLSRRFGSWKKVLELSGLETKGHNFKYDFSDEDVVEDLKRVANLIGKESLIAKEYNEHGKYYSTTLIKRYGTWNNILKMAGMSVNLNRNFTDEELFEEIERVWILLGRQPTTSDIKNGISKFSLNSFARRFGGWRGALQAFVNYINSDEVNVKKTDVELSLKDKENGECACKIKMHRTSRDVNLRLRFLVMSRDNFKCCMCGSSPATNAGVELHIDHIVPWSKGGETVIDNLQTLCSSCNLGKSDLILNDTSNIE